jgi:hypothetical protein
MATTYVVAYAGDNSPAPGTESLTTKEELLTFLEENQIYRTSTQAADWFNDTNPIPIPETDGSKYVFLTFIDGVLQNVPVE